MPRFFPGFAWPVPRAFAAAVAGARFEAGDVLYDDRRAYEDWRAAQATLGHWLQVLTPARSVRAKGESEGGRFDANWRSEVTLTWRSSEVAEPRRVETTQGRLFSCLWRGEAARLSGGAEPPLPRLARELQSELPSAEAAIRKALPDARAIFALAYDSASDAALAKVQRLRVRLSALGPLDELETAPEDCGLPAGEFHPALRVLALSPQGVDAEAMRPALRRALYGAGGGAEPEEDDATDRFNPARHGLLLE